MKTIVLLLLALSVCALADQTKFQTKLTSLLNMQAKAVDAVESALNLLRDLKQANIDQQAAADELNRTQEEILGRQIADLTFIADQNKATGDEATAHVHHLQNEIEVTHEYLVWITNRRQDIHRQRDSFQEHRCYASLAFVKALKEHDEALEVIRWLREDVLGIVQEYKGETVDFAQIQDSASKLKAYAHLFNDQALKEFNQLTQAIEPGHEAQAVDEETGQWDESADDNERETLEVERMGAGTEERDVGNKLLAAIDKLEQHLIDSMEDLKRNEIQAAWDLVRWLQDTEAELVHLDEEQEVKTTYMDKLLIAIVGAKAHEDRVWEIYFESASTLNDALDDLEAKRAWYAQEKARREEENEILDEIIRMFIERVSVLDSGMKTKVNDYSEDGSFDESDLARRTDTHVERDSGRLADNVDSESRV